MASAINLTGMLSRMNSRLGSTGEVVGQNMVAPLLEIQKEQRAEEQRKRLQAERDASVRGMIGDMTIADNAASAAQMNPNSTGVEVGNAIAVLEQAAMKNPDQAEMYMQKAGQLREQQLQINQRGSLKQYNDIDRWMDANAENSDIPEEVKATYMRRQQELKNVPGVSSAIAKQQDAALTGRIKLLQLENAEVDKANTAIETEAARVAMAIVRGANMEELQRSVGPQVWKKAQSNLADWTDQRKKIDDWSNSQKDLTGQLGKYEERYKQLRVLNPSTANAKIAQEIRRDEDANAAQLVKDNLALARLGSSGQVQQILGDRRTEWSMKENESEAWRTLQSDNPEEAQRLMKEATEYHALVVNRTKDIGIANSATRDWLAANLNVDRTEGKEFEEEQSMIEKAIAVKMGQGYSREAATRIVNNDLDKRAVTPALKNMKGF